MEIRILTSAEDLMNYDQWLSAHPEGTLWQSLAWREFQKALGREVKIYVEQDGSTITASALVVIDRTTLGLSTWEIPRGPLGGHLDILLQRIMTDAKNDTAMTLYFSPATLHAADYTLHARLSHRHIHPEATRILDLTCDDNALLAQMKPKGRYNIRLAQKHGLQVRQENTDESIEAFAALAHSTASRDGFTGHSTPYYRTFLQSLPQSFLLLAYPPRTSEKGWVAPQPIAGLLGVIWDKTRPPADAGNAAPAKVGIYYYGASDHRRRALMAPYLLQWEAMQYCRAQGCTHYDLFGIAPEGAMNHPWSGVTDFKGKFGGEYVEYPPEQQIVLRPFTKAALDFKRKVWK